MKWGLCPFTRSLVSEIASVLSGVRCRFCALSEWENFVCVNSV